MKNNIMIFFFFSLSLYAIESPPVGNIEAVNFNNGDVGAVVDGGATNSGLSNGQNIKYFIIDPKKMIAKDISKESYIKEFNDSKKLQDENFEIKASNGSVLRYKTICNKKELNCYLFELEFEKNKITVDVKKSNVCFFPCLPNAVEKFQNFLIVSFSYTDSLIPDGRGSIAFDLTTGKIINHFYLSRNNPKNAQDDANPSVSIMKASPDNKSIWVGGSYGLYNYNSNFKLLKSCELWTGFVEFDEKLQKEVIRDRFEFNCK